MRKLGQCLDDYYDVNFVRLSQLPSNFLRIAVLCVLSLNGSPGVLFGQDSLTYAAPRELHKDRLLVTSLVGGTAIVGSLVALDQAWYADYDRAPMHSFDDGDEWLQVDKAGHMWTTYTVGRWGMGMLDWCGTSESTARWVGGSLGLVYMTGVELLDGTSAGWGFSWWDMAANVAGTGLLIGQDLAWQDQRITMKFSAHLTPFAAQNPDLLGSSNPERIAEGLQRADLLAQREPEGLRTAHPPPCLAERGRWVRRPKAWSTRTRPVLIPMPYRTTVNRSVSTSCRWMWT